jgi:hypothetical protein
MKERAKFIIIDILGFACIIGSVLLGWLPGPGGIPLLIIGLSLLANNHEWAERLLKKVKVEGLRVFDKIFDGSTKTKWIVDIISVAVITGAVLLIMSATRSVLKTAGISLLIAAFFMLLSNRRRYHKVLSKVKPSKHKH